MITPSLVSNKKDKLARKYLKLRFLLSKVPSGDEEVTIQAWYGMSRSRLISIDMKHACIGPEMIKEIMKLGFTTIQDDHIVIDVQ